jgi:tetratricopeptide (TPR) repeat protein
MPSPRPHAQVAAQRALGLGLILCLIVGGPLMPQVHAQTRAASVASQQARARAYFEQGKKLSAAGRHAEALVEFSLGYELSKRPAFLFNMAECARAIGDSVRARSLYERYLNEAPKGDLSDLAKKRLQGLAPAPAPEVPAEARPARAEVRLAPVPVPQPVAEIATPQAPPVDVRPSVRLESAPLPRADLIAVPDRDTGRKRSVWRSPWLWAGVGAVVVTSSLLIYAASRDGGGCGVACADFSQ